MKSHLAPELDWRKTHLWLRFGQAMCGRHHPPSLRHAPRERAEFDSSDFARLFATLPDWQETSIACAMPALPQRRDSAPEIPPPTRYGLDTTSACARDSRAPEKDRQR